MSPTGETAAEGLDGEARSASSSPYEVGVAIRPAASAGEPVPEPSATGGIPGFDETIGRRTSQPGQPATLVEKGEESVRIATEAIAAQIGLTARRITTAVEAQTGPTPAGSLGLDSVQVAFGITLSAGLQTMFTALVESSVQVTITLSRQP